MIWIWVTVIVVSLLLEFFTWDLLFLWYAVGALVALLLEACGVSWQIQTVVAAVVSFVTLISLRRLAMRFLKIDNKSDTNVHALVGKQFVLLSEIAPSKNGSVKVSGIVWTAVGETYHTAIAQGTLVTVLRVEGNKLIVTQ